MVSTAVVGSKQHHIRGHADVKKFYAMARGSREPFKLVFRNNRNANSFTIRSEFDKDWSSDGEWIGKRSDGWAGGQPLKRRIIEGGSFGGPGSFFRTFDGSSPPTKRRSVDSSVNASPLPRLQPTTQNDPLSPKVTTAGPAIGVHGKKKDGKEETATKGTGSSKAAMKTRTLKDVARNGSIEELLSLLDSICFSSKESKHLLELQECYDDLKQYRRVLTHGKQEKEVKTKESILSIYIHSLNELSRAMALENWRGYKIEFKSMNLEIERQAAGGDKKLFGEVYVVQTADGKRERLVRNLTQLNSTVGRTHISRLLFTKQFRLTYHQNR